MLLHQTFDPADLGTVGLLVLLEGSLSVDNALVLGLLAGRLPADMAKRALAVGLVGAFLFRLAAIVLATYLLRWPVIKLVGAIYLAYLAIRTFFMARTPQNAMSATRRGFWGTVIGMELTDLTLAVDNILAAVALVGPPPPGWPPGRLHPKFWVVLVGGMMGLVLIRLAASAGVNLIRRHPGLNKSASLVLLVVAVRLALEWLIPNQMNFDSPGNPAFWAFWCVLAGCIAAGCVGGVRSVQ